MSERIRRVVTAAGTVGATSLALMCLPTQSAAQGVEWNATCGDVACRVVRVPVAWQLLTVGEDRRTLKLVYLSGGCKRDNGAAHVDETKSRIRITVDVDEVVAVDRPDPRPVCTQDLRYLKLFVRLRRPVAGRAIEGGPRISEPVFNRTIEHDGELFPAVPGVLDLSAEDATTVLRAQGFRVRRFGRRHGTVAFQSPAVGRRASPQIVRLTVGRRLFRIRAARACLARIGIRTIHLTPKPGDADAPDEELRLYDPRLSAFVAFYADPARARENARPIRRYARAFGGVVDRAPHVTVVWVDPPAQERRAVVKRCAQRRLG